MTIRVEIRPYTNKSGLQPIRIVLTEKGKRTYMPTKIFVDPKDWDENKQRVKPNTPNASIINQAIGLKLSEIQTKVAVDGVPEMLRKKEIGLFDFICEMDRKLSERNTDESMGVFRSQTKKLKEFKPKAKLQDVTPGFLEEYETWCRTVKGNKDGGINNTMQFINQVVNKGISKGFLPANQISEYEAKPYRPNNKIHLTREEMDRWQLVLETEELTERERLVGYYYLLSCYTALRHRDCMKLNIKMKVNGRLLLYTNKTGAPVSLKMSPIIESLFYKCLSLGKLPPNNATNPYLPAVAELAEIDKHISFHTARHTFGVGCANLGVPIEVCSKLMGHTDIKTTAIYYKLANPTLDKAMDLWK